MGTQKTILVFYISIGVNTIAVRARENLRQAIDYFNKDKQDDILMYFVPIRNGESKVECINPVLLNEEQYASTHSLLEATREKLEKYLSEGHREEPITLTTINDFLEKDNDFLPNRKWNCGGDEKYKLLHDLNLPKEYSDIVSLYDVPIVHYSKILGYFVGKNASEFLSDEYRKYDLDLEQAWVNSTHQYKCLFLTNNMISLEIANIPYIYFLNEKMYQIMRKFR